MSTIPSRIAVIDLETTGLGPDAQVLEVGLVIADSATLAPLLEKSWTVGLLGFVGTPTIDQLRASVDPVVQDMHDKSGLWADVAESQLTIEDVDQRLVALIGMFSDPDQPSKLVLAGSGVDRFDRRLIERDLPTAYEHLTYWSFDVSSMRRLVQLAGRDDLLMPGVLEPPHRALGDCRMHLDELRHWRDLLTDHVGWSTVG